MPNKISYQIPAKLSIKNEASLNTFRIVVEMSGEDRVSFGEFTLEDGYYKEQGDGKVEICFPLARKFCTIDEEELDFFEVQYL